MKTIRRIYHNFDRMIAADRFRGWNSVIWIHFWAFLAILSATIWGERLEAFLWLSIALLAYSNEVQSLALKEARAEVARLKANTL